MTADVADLPGAKETLDLAQSALGWSLFDLTEAELQRTTYTQPALFVVEAILSDRLRQQHQPAAVAGHSLGEYSALYCAGVFDFATGLELVQRRSQLMDSAREGTMAAVMGFDRAELERLCGETEGVAIANDNSPDQVVLSGTAAAIERVTGAIQPKRVVPLRVGGAFHSPFMAEAAEQFAQVLEEVDFRPAQIPVYSNVTASPSTDPLQLKENLRRQVTGSVRWREIVLAMAAQGIDTVWEVGPGKVLTGLAKRIDNSLTRANVATAADVAAQTTVTR
jgi:[acyl-carrier-protein] S-malonyltransferase